MVLWQGDELLGIVVRAAPNGLRPGIAAMCSLCHSTQPATQVRMFSARLAGPDGDSGSSIGTYICEDLACSHIIRTGPPHLLHRDRIDAKAQGLASRVGSFVSRIARATREA